LLAVVSWLWLSLLLPVAAHEGIVLASSLDEKYDALRLFSPIFAIWALISLIGLFVKISKPAFFHRYIFSFYLIQFTFTALLVSFPVWLGGFDRAQWFFIGHSVHSIFTLGTVLILDFLFLNAKSSEVLKQHIFPIFPLVSKFIWIGLGIEFLSVSVVFREAIEFTPKFFFMQTVVGILIINGVLLAGPIARKLVNSVKEGGEKMAKKWVKIGDIAGVISISSWFTITFVDSFDNLTLDYSHFFIFYIALILILLVGHYASEHFQKDTTV
jgi:hypothetical protein